MSIHKLYGWGDENESLTLSSSCFDMKLSWDLSLKLPEPVLECPEYNLSVTSDDPHRVCRSDGPGSRRQILETLEPVQRISTTRSQRSESFISIVISKKVIRQHPLFAKLCTFHKYYLVSDGVVYTGYYNR